MHTECVAENANIIFIWAPDPQPREREWERESTYYTIYRILGFHGSLPTPIGILHHLLSAFGCLNFSSRQRTKLPRNRQSGPKWSRLPCSGSRHRQNIWMRSEAFVCRGSLGDDSCASASGVRVDWHSAVKNFILAWTRLLDVTLKATRENRLVCKDCTVMLSHTHSLLWPWIYTGLSKVLQGYSIKVPRGYISYPAKDLTIFFGIVVYFYLGSSSTFSK